MGILVYMKLLTPIRNYVIEHRLSRKVIVKMGIDFSKALALCRRNIIIHRDIEPENVGISRMGECELGDFDVTCTLEKTIGSIS